MKSLDFPGAYLKIGEGQEQYHTIHAMPIADSPEGEIVCIYELTDLEVAEIVKNKKIFYSRLTFRQPFQPMRISSSPIPVPVMLAYEDGELKEVEGVVGPDGVTIPGYTKTPEGKYVKD